MSEKKEDRHDSDEIDEILIKLTTGRMVVKSLAEKALLFYKERKEHFILYEDFYKTHSQAKEHVYLENNQHNGVFKQSHNHEKPIKDSTLEEEIERLKSEIEHLKNENRKFRESTIMMQNATAREGHGVMDTEQIPTVQIPTVDDTDKVSNVTTYPNDSEKADEKFPTKIAERFRQLFNEEWKLSLDGFIQAKGTDSEETFAIQTLADVVKEIEKFCTCIAKQQIETMEKHVLEELTYPKYRLENGDVMGGLRRTFVEEHQREIAKQLVVTLRNRLGELSVRPLYQIFSNYYTKLPVSFEEIHAFIMKTTELIWMMKIQEPPIELEWTYHDLKNDRNRYNAYRDTDSDVVQYCVWPAVVSYLGGPILSKGVNLTK